MKREVFPPAPVPARPTLGSMRKTVQACRACPLYKNATQAVFGEGRAGARVLLIGEQPGNDEDLAGRPFVGPAGRVLNDALVAAGIDRAQTYVTNAVKHFKFERAGTVKRLHKRPNVSEVKACAPWLRAELAVVQPAVVVCLGATAAQAIFGRAFRLTQSRGRVLASPVSAKTLATIHPSAVLRQRTSADRKKALEGLVADLRVARRAAVRPRERRTRPATEARVSVQSSLR
ncbi:MAG TPA: UdgX family uracil-DNA binding protein [Gemmatimonadaceae bacterium]|nr:UdgX family uracil-DNA binding protein [Gemmatimonadaceae bacterium]